MKFLVFIQSHESKIHNNSLESLSAAQKLASNHNAEVHAVTFDKTVAENISQYDLSSTIYINNHLIYQSKNTPLKLLLSKFYNSLSRGYNDDDFQNILISADSIKIFNDYY